jgi:hypothetical protein
MGKANKSTEEFSRFDAAMTQILRADLKAVKEAMEREKQENAEQRKAKKKLSAAGRAVSGKD